MSGFDTLSRLREQFRLAAERAMEHSTPRPVMVAAPKPNEPGEVS